MWKKSPRAQARHGKPSSLLCLLAHHPLWPWVLKCGQRLFFFCPLPGVGGASELSSPVGGTAEVCVQWDGLLCSHTLPAGAAAVYGTLSTQGVLGIVPSPQPIRAAKVTEGHQVLKCLAQQEPDQGSPLPPSHDLCPGGGGAEGAQLSILGSWGFPSMALPLPPSEAFRPGVLLYIHTGPRTHLPPVAPLPPTPQKAVSHEWPWGAAVPTAWQVLAPLLTRTVQSAAPPQGPPIL